MSAPPPPSPDRPGRLHEASRTLGPALCTALVQSLPRPARRPADLVDSAGGIRTHGLELMRLARTASPLPRSLAGRSRTCDLRRPKPAGWPTPPQPVVVHSTPGGARTRSFRVEGPASSPVRPRGHEGRELRRQGSNLPLASNSRASFRLDHAGMNGRRGSRTPKGRKARPFSRRDTAPMAVLPNKSGFGKSRTCTSPGKSREL